MQTVLDIWKTWSPWIILSLIPSLIVGLSISPKTQGIADFLKKVLGYLSILTHKDETGTFQLPLKLGKKATLNTVTLFLVAVTCVGTVSSCCAWTGTCDKNDTAGQIATSAIDCTKQAIMEEAAHLLPAVFAILSGHAPDWAAQLDALKAMGQDALACALAQASQNLLVVSAPAPNEGVTTPQEVLKKRAEAAEAYSNATSYIKTNKWVFKGK